jgi:hypothetical protein
METRSALSHRVSILFGFVWKILLPVAFLMLIGLTIAELADVPVTDLLRDTTALLDGPWYAGFFSTAGIALWAATAAMSFLALSTHPDRGTAGLLIIGAVVSLILCVDDAYLMHETIKNTIGIPSFLTISAYGLLTIYLVWRARAALLERPDVGILLAGVALLALSVLLDAAGEADLPTPPLSAVFEDVFKFLGIVTWTYFFAQVARGAIRSSEVEPT